MPVSWLVVVFIVIGFLCWAGWVLHKRGGPRPGDPDHRQDHNFYGGPPGSGSAGVCASSRSSSPVRQTSL